MAAVLSRAPRAFLLALLLLGGCRFVQPADNPFTRGQGRDVVLIRVENRNFSKAHLYLTGWGPRKRLAEVGGQTLEFFSFPWHSGAPLVLEVEITTGERHRFHPLHVSGGDQLRLTIAQNVRRSTLVR